MHAVISADTRRQAAAEAKKKRKRSPIEAMYRWVHEQQLELVVRGSKAAGQQGSFQYFTGALVTLVIFNGICRA